MWPLNGSRWYKLSRPKARKYKVCEFTEGEKVQVGKVALTMSFFGELYTVPKKDLKPPTAGVLWYEDSSTFEKGMSLYEALYSPVNLDTIVQWTPDVKQLHNFSSGATNEYITLGIIKFYKDFILRRPSNWEHLVGNISALLNQVHNSGSMAINFGSKYTKTRQPGMKQLLKRMTNLHRKLPPGNDHKTLRYIYNNWRELAK
jgi:hypothetical protein